MKLFKEFGKQIKQLRSSRKENITEAAQAVGIDRSYLSKLESGKLQPSKKIVNLLISHYSLSGAEAQILFSWGGYNYQSVISSRTDQVTKSDGKEVDVKMENNQPVVNQNNASLQLKVPENLTIQYTDSVFITLSEYGMVFDIAQTMGPTNTQSVVARIGMSIDHAEALLNVLGQKVTEAKLRGKKERVNVKH